MPRHKRKRVSNENAHGGLYARHPELSCIELLEIAEVSFPKPAPKHTVQRIPAPEPETSFRKRRLTRLIPDQKPICPSDYF